MLHLPPVSAGNVKDEKVDFESKEEGTNTFVQNKELAC